MATYNIYGIADLAVGRRDLDTKQYILVHIEKNGK
jgi:hypothetical protein